MADATTKRQIIGESLAALKWLEHWRWFWISHSHFRLPLLLNSTFIIITFFSALFNDSIHLSIFSLTFYQSENLDSTSERTIEFENQQNGPHFFPFPLAALIVKFLNFLSVCFTPLIFPFFSLSSLLFWSLRVHKILYYYYVVVSVKWYDLKSPKLSFVPFLYDLIESHQQKTARTFLSGSETSIRPMSCKVIVYGRFLSISCTIYMRVYLLDFIFYCRLGRTWCVGS